MKDLSLNASAFPVAACAACKRVVLLHVTLDDTGRERCLRANDGQVNIEPLSGLRESVPFVQRDGHAIGYLSDSGVARSTEGYDAALLPEPPGDRVFTPARADNEDPH